MNILILVEDSINGILLKRESHSFESAEEDLGKLERAYKQKKKEND